MNLTLDEVALTDELTRRTNQDALIWRYFNSECSGISRRGKWDCGDARPKPCWRADPGLILWTQPGVEDFRRHDEAHQSVLEVNGKVVEFGPKLYWAIWAQHDRMKARKRVGDCAEAMSELGVAPLPEWQRVARRAVRISRLMKLLKWLVNL